MKKDIEKNLVIEKPITEKSFKVITRRANGTKRVVTINEDPSLTDQSQAEETDINNIMLKYGKTGHWPASRLGGIYADVSDVPLDLLSAYSKIQNAEASFAELPSQVRLKFNNNPQEMINFLQNPKNHEEAVKLGLLNKPQNNDELNDDKTTVKKQASKKSDPQKNDSSGVPSAE